MNFIPLKKKNQERKTKFMQSLGTKTILLPIIYMRNKNLLATKLL